MIFISLNIFKTYETYEPLACWYMFWFTKHIAATFNIF